MSLPNRMHSMKFSELLNQGLRFSLSSFLYNVVVVNMCIKSATFSIFNISINCQLDFQQLNLINPKDARNSPQELTAYYDAASTTELAKKATLKIIFITN